MYPFSARCKQTNVVQEAISGKLNKAMNASLNLDSVFVEISDIKITKNYKTPIIRYGKGQ